MITEINIRRPRMWTNRIIGAAGLSRLWPWPLRTDAADGMLLAGRGDVSHGDFAHFGIAVMTDSGRKSLVVLASSSPQRRQLLASAGVPFQVVSPVLTEPNGMLSTLPPAKQAEALAYFKARAVADDNPGATVLGADTIVALGQTVLGKPADAAEARRMLATISGTTHQVITGVALIRPPARRIITSDLTRVTMRRMSDEEIDSYVASGEWAGKAGGYAIQLTGDRYVEKIDGSFTNVVGLPMELVLKLLEQAALAGGAGPDCDAGGRREPA